VPCFNQPGGLALGPDGNLYVTEFSRQRILKVTPNGIVTTVAGTSVPGHRDGAATEAELNSPNGIVADGNGSLYVTETGLPGRLGFTLNDLYFRTRDVELSIDTLKELC
jgi:sugar lactone lactonase YvrE